MADAPNQIDFNNTFKAALDLLENTNEHVFITGRAGTGKSTLLRYFCETSKKNIVVLAPTGIAALNVRGQTIHSFFGFPPHPISANDIKKRRDTEIYENIDTIVIDEISMVRADMLDAIDYFMRINGRTKAMPFGGAQMVFIGDLFQLPPVISSDVEKQLFEFLYETPFFFSAHAMHNKDIKYVELDKVYRQKDDDFLSLLDFIRTKTISFEQLSFLNRRCCRTYFSPAPDEFYITLTSTNRTAQRINQAQLEELEGKTHRFNGEINGEFKERKLPNDMMLKFKEGAQVMFLRNDQHYRWVNGTLGKIKYLDDENITVEVSNIKGEKVVYPVHPVAWDVVKYVYKQEERRIETEVVGSFTQYPIKLAWAITIHKSQGKTFDKVIVDLGYKGAFAPGQVYVALSRCTSLEGLKLRRPLRSRDIIVDERILSFAKETKLYQLSKE